MNSVVTGLAGLKIDALMSKSGIRSTKKHPPSKRDSVVWAQNRFYYWEVYDNSLIFAIKCENNTLFTARKQ